MFLSHTIPLPPRSTIQGHAVAYQNYLCSGKASPEYSTWTVHGFFDLITEDLNGYSIVRVGIRQAKGSQYIAQTKKTKVWSYRDMRKKYTNVCNVNKMRSSSLPADIQKRRREHFKSVREASNPPKNTFVSLQLPVQVIASDSAQSEYLHNCAGMHPPTPRTHRSHGGQASFKE
jgi:hypothetical protein